MNVSLIGPELYPQDPAAPRMVHLARLLDRRGARVRLCVPGVSMELPGEVARGVNLRGRGPAETPDFGESDVCVYHVPGAERWLSEIRCIQRAVVILDCHGPICRKDARWLHTADLYLAATPEIRDDLVGQHGCAPDRVYTLLGEGPQYWEEMAQIVEQAAAGVLPQAKGTVRHVGNPGPQRHVGIPALQVTLEVVRDRADVAMREYTVRSRLPVVGPVVAWLRRNLTSHLRGPYLDAMVERQVAFNQEVVTWMEQTLGQLGQIDERLARLEEALGGEQQQSGSADRDETSQEALV